MSKVLAHTTKPFINTGTLEYNGVYPPFYSSGVCKETVAILEANTDLFVDEWQTYVKKQTQAKKKFFLLYSETGWHTIMLYSYGMRYHKNCKNFTKTLAALKPIKGLATAYISTLQPGTRLRPHWGDTDATYRIHLGLDIPGRLPDCGIEVGGEQRAWQNGKTIIFNDAHFHTAWNLTDKPRTVLIIDIIKPELLSQKWKILPGVLGAMGVGRVLFPLGLAKILPGFAIKALHGIATAIFFCFLPIQKSLRIFY